MTLSSSPPQASTSCREPMTQTPVLVAGKAAGLTYLWNAVRVQGGAYGVGVRPEASGAVCFWSFRDPGARPEVNSFSLRARRAADRSSPRSSKCFSVSFSHWQ